MTSQTYQWAMAYASRGWPVIPLAPESKVPATSRGSKDGSTDPDLISRWFDNDFGYNIGICTGYPGPAVVDVDVKPDVNGWQAFNRLKERGLLSGAVYIATTRSGGMHLGFTSDPAKPVSNASFPKHHLDIRGDGGYIVAPPSYVPGGFGPGYYTLVELADNAQDGKPLDGAAVRRLLTPAVERRQANVRPGLRGGPGGTEGLVRTVLESPESDRGGRHRAFYWALNAAVNDGLDIEPVIKAGREVGLDDQYVRRTVRQVAGATA